MSLGEQEVEQEVVARRVHGLFVGIDHYKSTVPAGEHKGRIDLKGCANDAVHLAEVTAPFLATSAQLINADADRESILNTLERVVGNAEPGDLFVFFCACHGSTRYGEFFLWPSDYDPRDFLGTSLLFQDIANAVGSKEDVYSLLIVDACQSGAIGFDPARHNRGVGSSIMVAAAPLEISREEVFEDVGRSHGVFAYSLIKKLKSVFGDGGPGSATVAQIFDGTYSDTKALTENKQHPIMVGTLPACLTVSRNGLDVDEAAYS